MRFNVLGPLEIVEDNSSIELPSHNQRATLGFLLLCPNRVVGTNQLINALWGYDTPASARKMLQNAVAGLRDVLPSKGKDKDVALVTRSPGYVLRVEPDLVDLGRFRRLSVKGRAELNAGQHAAAARTLHEALSLWRGSALEDLTESGIAWPELVALQNQRQDTFEDWAEVALATGHHYELVGQLEVALDAEPLRERLCRLAMLALYRCGRQADALEAYGRTRAMRQETHGSDIGPELRGLERAILDHDPSLTPPTANRGCYVRTATCQ
jgi:DNA-binding SARP family transcriptional activator